MWALNNFLIDLIYERLNILNKARLSIDELSKISIYHDRHNDIVNTLTILFIELTHINRVKVTHEHS